MPSPHYILQKKRQNVYIDYVGKGIETEVYMTLKTKYMTPRMYVFNRIHKYPQNRLFNWIDAREDTFRASNCSDLFEDYVDKCLEKGLEHNTCDKVFILFSEYFITHNLQQYTVLKFSTPLDTYIDWSLTYFLDNGPTIERIIVLLLERIHTKYIRWIDENEKIFEILEPESVYKAINDANIYHNTPTITFNGFKRQLTGYCMTNVLVEINKVGFKYQFNSEWYQNEMRATLEAIDQL